MFGARPGIDPTVIRAQAAFYAVLSLFVPGREKDLCVRHLYANTALEVLRRIVPSMLKPARFFPFLSKFS